MASNPPIPEKKTESVKVHMRERLYLDLSRLSAEDNRSLSDYINSVLEKDTYGKVKPAGDSGEGSDRD